MNLFRQRNKTITSFEINVTNIWSLSTIVMGATWKKLTRILDLKCAINILIDNCTLTEDVEKIFLSHKLKLKLGHFKHIGTYTKTKEIIVIYGKNTC